MRKFILAFFSMCVMIHAQVGVAQNAHGLRVPSAYTLQQGFFYISGNVETVSDGEPLAVNGFVDSKTGARTDLDDQAAAAGGAVLVSYGIFDFLELGVSLPIYYEGEVTNTNLDGAALGDLQGFLKVNIPLKLPIYLSFEGGIYAPTGTRSRGFRPRHFWFINDDKQSYAYTAGGFALSGAALLTLNFFDALLWNNYGGYVASTSDANNAFVFGSGFELFPNKMISLIAEITGEIRNSEIGNVSSFFNEMIRFTPGIRLHTPHSIDLMLGADIGFDFIRGRKAGNGIEVRRADGDREISYSIPGTPEIGFMFAISKSIDFSWKDSDRDGIADRLDMCPGSTFGVMVNSRGCPVDNDQDGILNIVDDCPETPFGVQVDFFGCPLDEDKDLVPDYLDKCPGTALGMAVDNEGCIRDSDSDGIDDNNDLCPGTSREEPVNSTGCPIDDDHDGVLNEVDKCPETPRGRSVDQQGCPLDFDKDGIPDDIDQCPNSKEGEIIDAFGCPSDVDKDGVPDSRDLCKETPEGFSVDQDGCPTDHDKDGIPDDLDKCPNTAEKAPVDSTGCPVDSDNDGTADYLDKCPETLPGVYTNKDGCPFESKMNLESIARQITFHGNRTEPNNSAYTAISDVIELLRRFEFTLEIEVSAKGPDAQSMSEKRAEHLFEIFKIKGYTEPRVTIKAVGAAFAPGVKFTAKDIKR